MSEQPQETPQETPTEAPEPTEAPAEETPQETPTEPHEPTEEPAEPVEPVEPEPVEPEQPQGMTEKELEAAYKKLGKLREHVADRVSAIMGEDSLALQPCPACIDIAPGFVWPPEVAPLSQEAHAGVRALLGMGLPRALKRHDGFQTCSDCDGEGFIDTGSKRDGYTEATCPRCVGKGYLSGLEVAQPTGTNGHEEQAHIVTGPTAYPSELPPEAQALRDKGWMVAPPISIGTEAAV